MNNECRQFLRSVRQAMPKLSKQEKRFLSDFSESVNEYISTNPNCTQEDLINQFGSPKDIALTYYSNMDSDIYLNILKRSRIIKTTCITFITAIIAALIIYILFLIAALNNYKDAAVDHIDTNITEIK